MRDKAKVSPSDLREGMRLFQAWYVSGESAWGVLHGEFKSWGSPGDRDMVRDLYCLAHGQPLVR